MIKSSIFVIAAITATSVCAAVIPEVMRREDGSELVARNPVEGDSVFLREDSGELDEREPFFAIGLARMAAKKIASRIAKHKAEQKINNHRDNHRNKRRKRDLEDEDMFERDFASEELSEREWEDLMERELAEEMLEREVGVEDDLD